MHRDLSFLASIDRQCVETTFMENDEILRNINVFYMHKLVAFMPVVERITKVARHIIMANDITMCVCRIEGPVLYAARGVLVEQLSYVQKLPSNKYKYQGRIGNLHVELMHINGAPQSDEQHQPYEPAPWELPFMMWSSEFGVAIMRTECNAYCQLLFRAPLMFGVIQLEPNGAYYEPPWGDMVDFDFNLELFGLDIAKTYVQTKLIGGAIYIFTAGGVRILSDEQVAELHSEMDNTPGVAILRTNATILNKMIQQEIAMVRHYYPDFIRTAHNALQTSAPVMHAVQLQNAQYGSTIGTHLYEFRTMGLVPQMIQHDLLT